MLPHGLDRLEIFARRVVSSNPETTLDATGVPFRASMVNALFDHGRCGMVSLATSRILRSESCSDSIRCATDSQWNLVMDILWYAKAGRGVCGDPGVVVDDTCNHDSFLASDFHCWHSLLAVSCLGNLRRILKLLYLAVE